MKRSTEGSIITTILKKLVFYFVVTTILLFAGIKLSERLLNTTQTAYVTPLPTVSPEETTLASPSPSTTPSANEVSSDIGKITIASSPINIRSTPSTSGELVGLADPSTTYNVYETQDNEGYTWYRISNDEWIPDGGNWLIFSQN